MLQSVISCTAPIQNAKIVNANVFGNCNMCKKNIENAGQIRGVANVIWDKNSKTAIITFDSTKVTKSEILKNIGLAGYDNESYLAPDEVYHNLPECCQYERSPRHSRHIETQKSENQKESHMNGVSIHHNSHQHKSEGQSENINIMQESKKTVVKESPFETMFEHYFQLKNALVNSSVTEATIAASKLVNSINNVNEQLLNTQQNSIWKKVKDSLLKDAKSITSSNLIDAQRNAFISLSEKLYQVIQTTSLESPVYYQNCPMANDGKGANWLSKSKEISNPYFGDQMLKCGKTIETID